MELSGLSFLAGERISSGTTTFRGKQASNGDTLEPAYKASNSADVDKAVSAAADAFRSYGTASGKDRAEFLRAIALELEAAAAEIVPRAMAESGLPQPRLEGELARTTGQLRLFASVAEEGSWQDARIDTALPDRKPLARPDLRSLLVPVGPVVVFGASNFPLAFSVAGGDTASALAAGNPVIVKAHPAHPGTSELVGLAIMAAIEKCALPAGVFSMLFDDGLVVAQELVRHPLVEAVTFTGSLRGGRALMDLAAARPRPIPCFTEMSSVNPVFILPGSLKDDPQAKAKALHGSFTLGAGQFCTKPGLVFLPEAEGADVYRQELRAATAASADFTMLTGGIADAYHRGVTERTGQGITSTAATAAVSPQTHAVLFEAGVAAFEDSPALQEEIFGPTTVLVSWSGREELLRVAEALEGHLTATLIGTEADLLAHKDLVDILVRKVGRIIFNGYPTGVEVAHAMVHGGPYPATSDSRFTSVGSAAILRFVRPRCYQNFPQALLPSPLLDENPSGMTRMINGTLTSDPLPAK